MKIPHSHVQVLEVSSCIVRRLTAGFPDLRCQTTQAMLPERWQQVMPLLVEEERCFDDVVAVALVGVMALPRMAVQLSYSVDIQEEL